MLKEGVNKDHLVSRLYSKLALVEMESKLIKISCSLMEDEVYTQEDAVQELIEIIDIIEIERQGVVRDMRLINRDDLD